MNPHNIFIALTIAGLAIGFPHFGQAQEAPEAWIAETVYGYTDLIPIVSYDVTAPPYSADRLGRNDSSKAFQDALADAEQYGGTVFAPAGRYRIAGNLSIPAGVTLRGDWRAPTREDARVGGTVLMAYAGRGEKDGTPFITVNEGGLRDLSIVYPEQNAQKVVPYPTSIFLDGNSAVRNLNLINPYVGIVTGSFSTVLNIYGSPLKTGVIMLRAVAVPRCSGIFFSPHYWSASGFPGAPTMAALKQSLVTNQAFAIQLNRQDAGIFIDIEIDNYPTGVKLMPPHGWTYWHDLRISETDIGMHFAGGSNHRVNITGSTISTNRYGILMQMDKTDWGEDWIELSKSGKEFGTRRDYAELRLFQCEFKGGGTKIHLDGSFEQMVDIQECLFQEWGTSEDDFAISVERGNLDVYDSEFRQSKRHLRYRGSGELLTLDGNQFAGSPDLSIRQRDGATINHTVVRDSGRSIEPLKAVPLTLPARVGVDSLYLATAEPYRAPTDGENDASAAIQAALNQAGRDGGGTVYLPQGRYRLTKELVVPPGVELRGVNDFMPRGKQVRAMLIADIPGSRGKTEGTALINLQSSPELGGSGLSGVSIWYPNQDYKNIQPFPYTIRSLGPKCWVRRIYLGNVYNGIDFATHNSDYHVLSRVNGSALNIGLFVGNSPNIGWIDNCHIRPQDWSMASDNDLTLEYPGNKPSRKDIFRGTDYSLIPNMRGSGAITIGSGANEQITGFFTNGSTRAFDFIDHNGTGGGNANILIGGSEAGWGAWVKALGKKGVTFVNFSFNPMTRLPYVEPDNIPPGNLPKGMVMRLDPMLPAESKVNMIISKFYGREEVDVGFDLAGGQLIFKQMEQEHEYAKAAVELNGGLFEVRNISIGETLE